MNHLPLEHLEVKVGRPGAVFVYLVLQVGKRHGHQIALGYGQHGGGFHLFRRDGPGREKVAPCGYRTSRLVLPRHRGPAFAEHQTTGTSLWHRLAAAAPQQVPRQTRKPLAEVLRRVEETDEP